MSKMKKRLFFNMKKSPVEKEPCIQKSRVFSKKSLAFYRKELRILPKEPCILEKELCNLFCSISRKAPCILFHSILRKEPCILGKELCNLLCSKGSALYCILFWSKKRALYSTNMKEPCSLRKEPCIPAIYKSLLVYEKIPVFYSPSKKSALYSILF